jgi:hypothetical protein
MPISSNSNPQICRSKTNFVTVWHESFGPVLDAFVERVLDSEDPTSLLTTASCCYPSCFGSETLDGCSLWLGRVNVTTAVGLYRLLTTVDFDGFFC